MYKGIFLDIDDTLYSYDQCHEYALFVLNSYFAEKFLITNFQELYIVARKDVASLILNTASSHNRLLYFQKLCELANIKAPVYADIMHNIYWRSFFEKMQLNLGVLNFLKLCKKHNIIVSSVTDFTADIQYRKLKKLKIAKYFDFMTSSEEVGFDKPNPKIFITALEKCKLKNYEVCMIGDNYEKDIIGAINIKIDGYLFSCKKIDYQDYKIFSNFKELINLFFYA
jgi:FMN phosphatase YigB (HAD superfamily)